MGNNTNRTRAAARAAAHADARTMDCARHLVRALAGSARAVAAQTGISGAQLFVLRQLADAGPAPLSVSELAERTLTHQSTVSGVVSRLAARRLVARATAADDARRTEVSLTARGRALLEVAPGTVQSQLVAGLAHLGAAEREALADGLEAWLAAAGITGAGDPPLFFEDQPAARPRRAARPARTAAAEPREPTRPARARRTTRGE